jgi:O-Antigen ligase
MTDAVVAWPSPRAQAAAASTAGGAKAIKGERLAVMSTAAAVAMIPLLSPPGPANIAPVDGLIALAVSSCLLWAGTSGHRLRFPYIVPMCLLMVGGALGALTGPVPGSGVIALVQDAILLVWCWAVVNLASSVGRLRVVVAAWAYGAIAWAVLLFIGLGFGLSFLTGQTEDASEGSRTALTFLDPNYAASYWFISIMVLWATGLPRHRVARVAAYVLLIAALISTGSNSGIVSLVTGVAVATVLATYHRFGIAAATPVFAALVLGGYLVATDVSITAIQKAAYSSPYAFVRDGIGRGEKSVAQRVTLRDQSIQLYREGGPLGTGPVSTKPRLQAEMAPYVKEAHDDYVAALVERGLLGLLGLAVLIASLVLRAPGLAIARLTAGFAAVVPRPHALIGAVVGSMAAMAVVELLHARHVWTLFAFVAALYFWGRR